METQGEPVHQVRERLDVIRHAPRFSWVFEPRGRQKSPGSLQYRDRFQHDNVPAMQQNTYGAVTIVDVAQLFFIFAKVPVYEYSRTIECAIMGFSTDDDDVVLANVSMQNAGVFPSASVSCEGHEMKLAT